MYYPVLNKSFRQPCRLLVQWLRPASNSERKNYYWPTISTRAVLFHSHRFTSAQEADRVHAGSMFMLSQIKTSLTHWPYAQICTDCRRVRTNASPCVFDWGNIKLYSAQHQHHSSLVWLTAWYHQSSRLKIHRVDGGKLSSLWSNNVASTTQVRDCWLRSVDRGAPYETHRNVRCCVDVVECA